MAGVIDKNGQQWERCNKCGKWVKFEKLKYGEKTIEFPFGRDLCSNCFNGFTRIKIRVPIRRK